MSIIANPQQKTRLSWRVRYARGDLSHCSRSERSVKRSVKKTLVCRIALLRSIVPWRKAPNKELTRNKRTMRTFSLSGKMYLLLGEHFAMRTRMPAHTEEKTKNKMNREPEPLFFFVGALPSMLTTSYMYELRPISHKK